MLSSILSWLFRLAFVLLILSGIINIIVQVQQKPIVYSKSKEGVASIGQPGILARAFLTSGTEINGPDTAVKYNIQSGKDNSNIGSGDISFRPESKKEREMNTQINLLVHRNRDVASQEGDYINRSSETLADGRVVWESSTINGKTNASRFTTRDTFQDINAAKIFSITNDKKQQYKMLQEGTVIESIRLKPSGSWQLILFVLYYAALSGSIALLMLTLGRLFSNFKKREYFTLTNIKQLGNIGWLLLIPEILQTILYWAYLARIQPVKIILNNTAEIKETVTYQFISGIEWQLVFLALGILILSYIFKNGLAVKEANALII